MEFINEKFIGSYFKGLHKFKFDGGFALYLKGELLIEVSECL